MKKILQFVVMIIAAIVPLQGAHADILADVQGGAVKTAVTETSPKPLSIAAEAILDPAYKIGPEDVIEISVWKEEGLRKEVLVRPDGGISFPLVGEIQAAGRTAEQIRGYVADELRKSINDPVVSVSVLKVAGNRIYVIGRVNKPGEFVAGRYIDVLQALSMAGGLTPYAAENDIKVLRRRGGKEDVFLFRYSDIRRGNNLEQNITLQGGDVVLVP